LAGGLAGSLEGLYRSVRWHRTPTLSLEHHMSAPDAVVLRQRFDFAAAHRLHAPELSAEENERIFGKCNNPSGHGHNYVVEPAVSVGISDGATGFGLRDLEELCINLVIDRFDHTHLNIDTEEFGPDGVMPSVENIARVIHRLLDTPIADRGARLDAVTVWETDRTCCTYPAGSPG
ncbi:MAG: 6-carboxytetrahydropterin synthase, partial [Planctomycetota bacterium]